MLTLAPAEKILLTMRRHWIVFVAPTLTFFLFLLIPPIAFVLARMYLPFFSSSGVEPVADFFLALYFSGLLVYMLILWLKYYLDVWIITSERIIDIEQKTLFQREISEMTLDRIQNVTIEIPGFFATMMRFGNIKIQTAGAGEFTVSDVTDFNRAKDLILQYSRRAPPPPTAEPPGGSVPAPPPPEL